MGKMLLGLVSVTLVLLGALVALLRPSHCPVNETAFERVKIGMTRAEVQAILGGPEGDYRTAPKPFVHHASVTSGTILIYGNESDPAYRRLRGPGLARLLYEWDERWKGDDGVAVIRFTPEGIVDEKRFELDDDRPSPLDRARWRLQRLTGR